MTRKVRDIWIFFGKVVLYGGQTTSRRHEKKSHVTTNSMQNIVSIWGLLWIFFFPCAEKRFFCGKLHRVMSESRYNQLDAKIV